MSYMKALNTGDVETLSGLSLEGGIRFHCDRAFPIVVNIARGKKLLSRFFQTYRVIRIEYKPDYRVIGNTGLVWGHLTEVIMNKEKRIGKRIFRKFSMTYVKSEGKWKIAVFHASPIPTEEEVF